jgi:hypothetical protein
VAVAGRRKEELFFFAVSTQIAQVSLEQRDPSGERFEGTRSGPGEVLCRFGGTYAVVAVAGRGGENFFFFTVFPADSLGVAAAAR